MDKELEYFKNCLIQIGCLDEVIEQLKTKKGTGDLRNTVRLFNFVDIAFTWSHTIKGITYWSETNRKVINMVPRNDKRYPLKTVLDFLEIKNTLEILTYKALNSGV